MVKSRKNSIQKKWDRDKPIMQAANRNAERSFLEGYEEARLWAIQSFGTHGRSRRSDLLHKKSEQSNKPVSLKLRDSRRTDL